jgi:hypothetical protein
VRDPRHIKGPKQKKKAKIMKGKESKNNGRKKKA